MQRRADAGQQLEAGAAGAVVAGDLPMPGRPVCTWSSCRRLVADHQRLPELLRLVLPVGLASSSARLHLVEYCRTIARHAVSPAARRWPAICR